MEVKPLIAMTSSSNPFGEFNSAVVKVNYLKALARAGGNPVAVNKFTDFSFFDHVNGLFVPGGRDVCPALYNQEPSEKLGETFREDDEFEIAVINYCYRKGIPIFGVCRGVQILNVAFGGTLLQHIDNHIQSDRDRDITSHSVTIKPDSLLFKTTGKDKLMVNSLHHQAIDKVASGFTVVAVSEDGITESIENSEHNVLGVQWHPEILLGVDGHFNLFRNFIKTAKP